MPSGVKLPSLQRSFSFPPSAFPRPGEEGLSSPLSASLFAWNFLSTLILSVGLACSLLRRILWLCYRWKDVERFPFTQFLVKPSCVFICASRSFNKHWKSRSHGWPHGARRPLPAGYARRAFPRFHPSFLLAHQGIGSCCLRWLLQEAGWQNSWVWCLR